MKISYNWIKAYVPELPAAEKLADVFTYHLTEVESVEKTGADTLFDLNILPNRAHDLLSHQGVARELAGQLGLAFADPQSLYKIPESKPTKLEIAVETPLCRRYSARIVRNVKIGPSPAWVVEHLESIGQRSINNIVDATNVCMFDCGQPLHAFDLRKLSAEKITIRQASEGELMTTLDGKAVVAKNTDMVIADGTSVLALAGVKGGTHAEVDTNTVDIVLEVANFDPSTVRKTARRLGILTDSAKRFENDLSPSLCDFAMKELSGLIVEMCPEAIFEDVIDVYPEPEAQRELSFSVEQITAKLGTEITENEVETILQRYSFSYTKEGSMFTIVVPALRHDLVGAHDMVEEIGRIIGYDKVVPTIPTIDFVPEKNVVHMQIETARGTLLADGYSEVETYTFTKKGSVQVARGAKGKEYLRTNLSDGLKASYELNRLNAPLLGNFETKIFEVGTVFTDSGEEIHVAYADKKGIVESTLEEYIQGLNTDAVSNFKFQIENSAQVFHPWSIYPHIVRDIALWVPEHTDSNSVQELLKNNGGTLLVRDPYLFDSFTKEGKTSYAFRFVFQSPDRTLTEEDVTPEMVRVTAACIAAGFEAR